LALTKINKSAIIIILNASQKEFGKNKTLPIGNHPPKKKIILINDKTSILPYSAKKNNANAIELYSIL